MTAAREPQASRPTFPAGYQVPTNEEGLLPWSYAREQLEQAQNYWICTASPTCRPHAAPLWGAWVDDRLYFEGSPATRWGRNLTANPYVSVHLESGSSVVIVEGPVDDIDDVGDEILARVTASFAAKYNGYSSQGRGFFILSPRLAFGWRSFPADTTRWRFGGAGA